MLATKSIAFVCLGDWDSTLCLRAKCIGHELEKQGWKIWFLLSHSVKNVEFAIGDPNIQIVPKQFISFVYSTSRWLRQNKPRYLHFLNPEVKAAVVSVVNRKIRVIGDWEDWHSISRDKGIKRLLTVSADWYMRRRSSVKIVCSRWLQDRFNKLGLSNCHYVPYAVLPKQWPVLPSPFKSPTAVFMGNFARNWDHDILIQATAILKSRGETPAIRMIGRGQDFRDSVNLASRLGLNNIEFTGYLDWDEMLNSLKWAHVLLFPIRDNETNRARCPFKVFQYAQAHRPIITSAVGEVPYFLGNKATYVDCRPLDFANALSEAMAAPRIDDVDYGIEVHSWERRAEAFIDALTAFESTLRKVASDR